MFQPDLVGLLELSKEAITVTTLDGIIIGWNRSAERIYGYPASEIMGKDASLLIPENRSDQQTYIVEGLRQGETIEGLDTQRVRKDGSTIDVSLTLAPLRDEHGRIGGICCFTYAMA